jgi:hypothetical protein
VRVDQFSAFSFWSPPQHWRHKTFTGVIRTVFLKLEPRRAFQVIVLSAGQARCDTGSCLQVSCAAFWGIEFRTRAVVGTNFVATKWPRFHNLMIPHFQGHIVTWSLWFSCSLRMALIGLYSYCASRSSAYSHISPCFAGETCLAYRPKRRGPVISYLGYPWFEPRPWDRLSGQSFFFFFHFSSVPTGTF